MTTTSLPALRLEKVVVLGANGAMGAGSAAMFAAGGCEVTLVARELAKSEAALSQIQSITKSERVADPIRCATYSEGLAELLADADLIFECLAEDLPLKKEIFAQVDAVRPPNALVATVSSGLSIRAMAEGLSEGFQSHFAGIHLYNPPHVMTGVEVIPHPAMNQDVVHALEDVLTNRFGRAVVTCADMPAFAGNRIGFKVLNEVAQLAEVHGVQMMDTLVGSYTGRAMPPLQTIDLVGWDVHEAIVDNVAANVQDEAIAAFTMPAYMRKLAHRGHLGDKTPDLGGFYRKVTEDGKTRTEALDPASATYKPIDPALEVPFVEQVRALNRSGRYQQAIDCFMDAEGAEADIARKVVLGYVTYALNRVGPDEVVQDAAAVDRIMTAGFNWAPPTALADLIGLHRTVEMLKRYDLPSAPLLDAAIRGDIPSPLFNLPFVTPGRYFAG